VSTELALRLIAILNDLEVPCMLVGSYSSNYYGRPRSTKDADFVVEIAPNQMSEISARLGDEFHLGPQHRSRRSP
jgi:hypothetical protein